MTSLSLLWTATVFGEETNPNEGPEGGPYFTHLYWMEQVNGTWAPQETLYTATENLYQYHIPITYPYMKRLRQSYHLINLRLNTLDKGSSTTSSEHMRSIIYLNTAGDIAHQLQYDLDHEKEARLADLKINGVRLPDFIQDDYQNNVEDDIDVNTYTYSYKLPYGSPLDVTAVAVDRRAQEKITVAGLEAVPTTVIINTASTDGTVHKEYRINIDYIANDYLDYISVDEEELIRFQYEMDTYNVALPYGFDNKFYQHLNEPEATPYYAFQAAGLNFVYSVNDSIVVDYPSELPGTIQVQVKDEDYVAVLKEYAINLAVLKNTDATLSSLKISDEPIAGFDSKTTSYTYMLPYDATEVPAIHPVATDDHATVSITPPTNVPGTATVLVTAEDGTTTETYMIDFILAKNPISSLKSLAINTITLENFKEDTLNYTQTLPYGTTDIPTIEAVPTSSVATVSITQPEALPGKASILVTAEDTSQTTYYVDFLVAKNTDATLSSLMIDGTPLNGFNQQLQDYTITLPYGTSRVPVITATPADSNGNVTITPPPSLPGKATVAVTAEDGITTKTYTVDYKIAPYVYYYTDDTTDEEVTPTPPVEPPSPVDKLIQDTTLEPEEITSELENIMSDLSEDMQKVQDETSATNMVNQANKTLEKTSDILEDLPKEHQQQVVDDIIEVAENLQYALEKIDFNKEQVDTTVNSIQHMGDILTKVDDNTDQTEHLKETIVSLGEKALEKVGEIDLSGSSSAHKTVTIKPVLINNHIARTAKSIEAIKDTVEDAVGNTLASELESSITITVADPKSSTTKVVTNVSKEALQRIEDHGITNLTLHLGKTSFKLEPDTFRGLPSEEQVSLEVKQLRESPKPNNEADYEELEDVPILDLTATTTNETIERFTKPMEVYFDLSHLDASGYTDEELADLTVYVYNDQENQWEPVGGKYDPVTKKIKVYRIHFSKYTVMKSNKSFSDVRSHSSKKKINVLLKKGFLTENDTFKPEEGATREEFISWISKTLGLESEDAELDFADVSEDSPYYQEIAAAYEAGLIDGRSQTHLAPEAIITKEEALKIIGKALAKYDNVSPPKDLEMKLASLNNNNEISDWAKEAVAIAKRERYITDDAATSFDPQDTLNRAEAAELLYTFYDRT